MVDEIWVNGVNGFINWIAKPMKFFPLPSEKSDKYNQPERELQQVR